MVEHVTVFEFMPQMKADAVLQKKLASLPNVEVILNAQTTEVLGDGSKVTGLAYKDRATDGEDQVELEGIFVQIGLLPNTDWPPREVERPSSARSSRRQGPDQRAGVFAAGDCTHGAPTSRSSLPPGRGDGGTQRLDHLIRTSAWKPWPEAMEGAL